MFVKNTFFSPQATPNKSAYLLIAEESNIPGLSLLSNIRGLSIDPVALITFLALIFNNLCLVLFFLSSIGKWKDNVQSIINNAGSVQHLDIPEDLKRKYKTAYEIKQNVLIRQSAERGPFIDQSQSLNLMIHPSTPPRDINKLLIEAWELGVKTLYYHRGTNPAQELSRNLLTCSSCEG